MGKCFPFITTGAFPKLYLYKPITQSQQFPSMRATGLDKIADSFSIGDDKGLVSSNIPTPEFFTKRRILLLTIVFSLSH